MKMWLKTSLKILVLFFSVLGLAHGSCNSFGHSCWGAHGKRSNVQTRHTDDDWKFLRIAPENNDISKSEISSQLFSENDTPIYENIHAPNIKTIDTPEIASDENQNNLDQRFSKKKYRISKYKARMGTGSNEEFEPESKHINLPLRDEYKLPDYRLLKMIRKELIN